LDISHKKNFVKTNAGNPVLFFGESDAKYFVVVRFEIAFLSPCVQIEYSDHSISASACNQSAASGQTVHSFFILGLHFDRLATFLFICPCSFRKLIANVLKNSI